MNTRDQVINQLKALDLNNNGVLEPSEANPTSTTLMNHVGLDTGVDVSLETLTTAVKQVDLEKLGLGWDFGIATEGGRSDLEFPDVRTRASVSEFTGDGHPVLSDPTPFTERYSELVIAEVRSLLARHDANRNGVLDASEINSVPWSKPHPSESDLDQTGVLTDIELAERLTAIAEENGAPRGRRSRSRSGEGETERSDSSSQGRSRSPRRSSSRSSGSTDRVATYIRDLLAKNDADKDGQMSLEEAKAMRNPPPPSVDKDQDGKFSFAELYGYYGDGDSSESSEESDDEDDSRPALPGTIKWDASLLETEANESEWPSALARKDRNEDQMISFGEFAETYDQENRDAFAAWDQNGDGYITIREANDSRNSEIRSSSRSSSRSTSRSSSSSRWSRSRRSRDDEQQQTENAENSKDDEDGRASERSTKTLPGTIRYSLGQ